MLVDEGMAEGLGPEVDVVLASGDGVQGFLCGVEEVREDVCGGDRGTEDDNTLFGCASEIYGLKVLRWMV